MQREIWELRVRCQERKRFGLRDSSVLTRASTFQMYIERV